MNKTKNLTKTVAIVSCLLLSWSLSTKQAEAIWTLRSFSTNNFFSDALNYYKDLYKSFGEKMLSKIFSSDGKSITAGNSMSIRTEEDGSVTISQFNYTCENGNGYNEEFRITKEGTTFTKTGLNGPEDQVETTCKNENCPAGYTLKEDYVNKFCGNKPSSSCENQVSNIIKNSPKVAITTSTISSFRDAFHEEKFTVNCTKAWCYKDCSPKTCADLGHQATSSGVYGSYNKVYNNLDTCFESTSCQAECPAPSCAAYPGTQLVNRNVWNKCNQDAKNFLAVSGNELNTLGIYRCEGGAKAIPQAFKVNSPDTGTCGIGTGDQETRCAKLLSCADQYGTQYENVSEYGNPPSNFKNFIFDTSINKNRDAGINGHLCGQFIKTSEAWYQVVTGSIYSQNLSGNQQVTQQKELVGICPSEDSSQNGKITGLVFEEQNNGTISLNGNETLTSSTFEINQKLKEDYTFFANLIEMPAIGKCTTIEGIPVCHYGDNTRASNIDNSNSLVAFVEGTFIVDKSIKVAHDNFKAFIVKDSIKVNGNIGQTLKEVSDRTCLKAEDANLQGIYIASDFEFEGDKNLSDDFNPGLSCDRELVVSGTLAKWNSGNFAIHRTFKGCALDPNLKNIAGGDGNSLYPIMTFFYNPDLILHTPQWMKSIGTTRLETI